jgi:tetratricopeptide (TPR) repeat protein
VRPGDRLGVAAVGLGGEGVVRFVFRVGGVVGILRVVDDWLSVWAGVGAGEMDPVSLILVALVTGAATGPGEKPAAVADAYRRLRDVLRRRLAGRPAAEDAVERYAADPGRWKGNLEVHLKQAGADQDPAVVDAASQVLRLADPAGAGAGKYTVHLAGAPGVQAGDSNTQTHYLAGIDEVHDTFRASPVDKQARERVLGPDLRDTVAARLDRAMVCQVMGRAGEAIAPLEQNLADYQRVLGSNHTDTLAAGDDLAQAYRAAGRLDEAIALLAEREEMEKIRPDLDGRQIMEVLGVPPGPVVGEAIRFLLELRMEHGPLGTDRAVQELRRWAEAGGVPGPAGGGGPAGEESPGDGPASRS